ncbi:hypothetical protein BH11PLA2_BH11PLA2_20340 [soil metagenome]
MLSVIVSLTMAGCSRKHYRQAADKEVSGILTQKDIYPDWAIENWHVYPDARARFADPDNADHPPYPPDDYPAWLLSPNPQHPTKKWGTGKYEGTEYLKWIENWDAQNRVGDTPETSKVDPNLPTAYLNALKNDQQPYRLSLEQCVELAIFNSREFQDRREDLYIAALPVTVQRFSFAAQTFAGSTVLREYAGRDRADTGNRWRIDTDATVSRLFPTGGTLLFRFANEVVLDLTSQRPDISFSNLSLSLIQPLLRGGGYAVTLEALTQSERTLLYGIRSYARFRKIFYAAIAVAGDYTNNPYGLPGLSVNLGRGVGVNFTAPTVGYLPTVLRAASLRNDRENILALEKNLKLINNLKEGGNSTQLQVIQAEQQLLQSRADFLTSTRLYQDQLDNFKLQLGVPATLPLELDDAPLKPMRQQLQKFDELYVQMSLFETAAAVLDANDTEEIVRTRWKKLLTESELTKGTPFAKNYDAAADRLQKLSDDELLARTRQLGIERDKLLDASAERQLAGKEDTPADVATLDTVETAIGFLRFETAIRDYLKRPWLRLPLERRAIEQAASYRAVADGGTLLGIRARNQRQDSIRAAWPAVPAVVIEGADLLQVSLDEAVTQASQIALTNRLDLMNTRAQLVDAYRQIAVSANALEGYLDVRYDFETASPVGGPNGGALGGQRSRNAVTMRVDPPFVRRVERNAYRASLIAFQRQRRFLMAVEDNIVNDVRAEVRQLRALAESYKLQARAVELAYAQVDSARSTLVAPPDPGSRESAGNVAALTDQLLRAQAQLLKSQNSLYTVWITYQTARTNLFLDLEKMPLDAKGLWTDDNFSLPDGGDAPAAAPESVPR